MGSPGDRRYSTPPLEIFGKTLVGLTLVLGLVGVLLLAVGGSGRSSGEEEPSSVQPARSPVCLRVDAEGDDERTPLESALTQRFATTGSDPFTGWPRLVDGFWRWDGVGADADYANDVTAVDEIGSVEDEQLVEWTSLGYDLDPVDPAGWQASAVLLSGGDETRAARLAALGEGLRLTVPSSYLDDGVPDDALPHPLLPESIPPGGTLVVDRAAFDAAGDADVAQDLGAAVPNLGDDDVALAITPLGQDRLVVTTGTESAVQQMSSLGLQVGSAAAELTDSDSGDYAFTQLTLDLGSAGGRTAYLDALGGVLPAPDDDRVHRVDVTGGARAAERARALEPDTAVPESFFADGLRRSVEERTDGTVTFTRNRPAGDQARRFSETYADGELAGVEALVRMVDVSAADASRYNRSFAGSEAEVSGPVTIDLVLDSKDLEQIRSDAAVLAAQRFTDDPEGKRQASQALDTTGVVTAADVTDWLEATVPARARRVLDAIAPGDDFVDTAMSDVLVSLADAPDAWTTYLAYTSALEADLAAAPRSLASWGDAVRRASGRDYLGFGRVACASV